MMEGRPRHRMSKKLQLAFSERRIRKGIYRMYARLRPYHLIGAIGGFLTVLTAIISLAVSTSYYISAEWVIIVNMLLIGSNGLIATYFFGAFSASRDSLIKVGSLIAGIGLGFNVLISILQMAGVYVFVLALRFCSGSSWGSRYDGRGCDRLYQIHHALPERRFCRGVLRVYFPGASAVFILDVGKPDKRRWAGWPADLFLRPQYHLLDSFSHSGYFLVYRGCTVWLR